MSPGLMSRGRGFLSHDAYDVPIPYLPVEACENITGGN